MKTLPLRILFLVLLLGTMAASALGATQMRANVVASGGAQLQSPAYELRCTVGQPTIGRISSPSYLAHIGFWSPVWWMASDVTGPEPGLPLAFALSPGGPNPFAGETTVHYAVPRPSVVSVKLYDLMGREVQTLVDGWVDPGYHAARVDASSLPNGIYFCRMVSAGFARTNKLVVVE